MRTLVLIAFILIFPRIHGQSSIDTTIRKIQLDSMQNLIFQFKDSTRRLYYEYQVFSQSMKKDTVFMSKDSLCIFYRSKSGKILKRVVQAFRRPDCMISETIDYLNRKELPEFTIVFERSCLTKAEAEEGNLFDKLSYYYERKVYDTLDRIVVRVFWYPRMAVTRFEYSYDKRGRQMVNICRINRREFWD